MNKITVYHNHSCGKSNCVLDILKEKGETPVLREYLLTPPTADEIREILKLFHAKPLDIIRTGETIFQEKFERTLSDEEYIEAIIQYPILLQRPIIIKNGKAIIGRPPEKVIDFLNDEYER